LRVADKEHPPVAVGVFALGIGAGVITMGYLLLCALIYGSRSDPFGVASLISLGSIGVGVVVVDAGTLVAIAVRLRRRDVLRAAAAAVATAVGAALAADGLGWIALGLPRSEWLLPAMTGAAILGAAIALDRSSRVALPALVVTSVV